MGALPLVELSTAVAVRGRQNVGVLRDSQALAHVSIHKVHTSMHCTNALHAHTRMVAKLNLAEDDSPATPAT